MGNALGDILPMAIGVAISPVPIIAVILMLFTQRARSNGVAFLLGWVLALAVVGSIILILANLGKISSGGTASTLGFVLKLLLGLLFLFMAVRQWRGRPKEGEEPHMPNWMASIDQFTPGKAFGFAAVLAGVNPKNLGLTLAAALSIAEANVSDAESWIMLAVFVIIASLTVAVPVLYYLFAGQSAEKTLTIWKNWLAANNATVMCILLLVLGMLLVGQGLGGLIG
jgi:Sap, sulfolipid-1-addressing protein